MAPGVTFLRRHTLNSLKPLTPPNIQLHGSLCDTPPHKHSRSVRGCSKHTSRRLEAAQMQQRCGAAESLCSETLMSAAVRQQLIVMLISKLLPPSLHSFSSSFVLSLSLSLRHSPALPSTLQLFLSPPLRIPVSPPIRLSPSDSFPLLPSLPLLLLFAFSFIFSFTFALRVV